MSVDAPGPLKQHSRRSNVIVGYSLNSENRIWGFSSGPGSSGGREGIRTPDPLLAKQVLSQLSYTPTAGTFLNSKAFVPALKLRKTHAFPLIVSRLPELVEQELLLQNFRICLTWRPL
jgi:hypothetical protein